MAALGQLQYLVGVEEAGPADARRGYEEVAFPAAPLEGRRGIQGRRASIIEGNRGGRAGAPLSDQLDGIASRLNRVEMRLEVLRSELVAGRKRAGKADPLGLGGRGEIVIDERDRQFAVRDARFGDFALPRAGFELPLGFEGRRSRAASRALPISST